jgi:predicted metalloprotease
VRYRRGQQSGYVDDQRGRSRPSAGLAIGGGGGIVALIIGLIAVFAGGGGGGGGVPDLTRILDQLGGGQSGAGVDVDPNVNSAIDDDTEGFMNAVMNDLMATWTELFQERGQQFEPTTLVLFTDAVATGCGNATEAVGPFYCPADRQAYIDLGFFQDLSSRFGAPGDFAQAYVIAHEIGHHVQNLLGQTQGVESVRVELQADCYAGVWAKQVFDADDPDLALSDGDIEEGLDAAAAVGDDRIQEQAGVDVNPETWTHGSAEQRTRWFRTGYASGDPAVCDTSREPIG